MSERKCDTRGRKRKKNPRRERACEGEERSKQEG